MSAVVALTPFPPILGVIRSGQAARGDLTTHAKMSNSGDA